MPTIPATRSDNKGVRRPFGNININRADPNLKPAIVVKQNSKPPTNQSPRDPPTVAISRTIPSTSPTGDNETRQEPFVFRDESDVSRDDALSLKLANPITEEDSGDSSSTAERDEDDEFLPFTRADGTAIVESLDALQLRCIFRRAPFGLNDDTLTLKRANPIDIDDDVEIDNSTSDSYPGGHKQTLYMDSLVSDSTLIWDLLSCRID
jgi:hypothetical protein